MQSPQVLDDRTALVKADYNARVGQWREIYTGTSFHDHTIGQRLTRSLALVDRLAPRSVLDVGCGAGQLLVELAGRGIATSGVDVAEGMVEASRTSLRAAGLPGDVRQADATALPYASGSFDLVTALGMIEYLRRPEAFLREATRVLAPGGALIVTSPNPVRLSFLCDPVRVVGALLRPPPRGYPRRYFHAWALRRLLTGAGFSVDEVQGHGVGEWTIGGRPVLAQATSIRVGMALERQLPGTVLQLFGANLIALARTPG